MCIYWKLRLKLIMDESKWLPLAIAATQMEKVRKGGKNEKKERLSVISWKRLWYDY